MPAPTLQHQVVDDFGQLLGRADFGWEEFRLLGEFDGKIKYGRLLKQGETPTDVVLGEKRREDAMRSTGAACHASLVRGAAGLDRPHAWRLRHELEQSHRLYVRVAS